MAKFALKANPTFVSTVGFPIAGGDPVKVAVTFRHRTKTQLDEFIRSREGRTDTATFLEMVAAWDLDDEFNAANVEILLENHIGVAVAAYQAYIEELVRARRGN